MLCIHVLLIPWNHTRPKTQLSETPRNHGKENVQQSKVNLFKKKQKFIDKPHQNQLCSI